MLAVPVWQTLQISYNELFEDIIFVKKLAFTTAFLWHRVHQSSAALRASFRDNCPIYTTLYPA